MRFELYILCEPRKPELGSVMEAQSKLCCVSEARALPASSSRPILLGPGHFPSWVIWQWALIFRHLLWQEGRKSHLMIITYPLCPFSRVCAHGPAPLTALLNFASMRYSPTWQPLGSTRPVAETGCNVSKRSKLQLLICTGQ